VSDEEWKPIDGHPGYSVSSAGRVSGPNGILAGDVIYSGYRRVKLRSKHHLVHRLVAEAFVERRDGADFVDHIDHDRSNNTSTNLQFVSHQENVRRSMRAGRKAKSLSPELVSKIRETYSSGRHTQREVAKMFGCSQSTVSFAVRGVTWGWTDGEGWPSPADKVRRDGD